MVGHTLTVRVAPLPDTSVTYAPVTVPSIAKSPASTPVTVSLKVTVNATTSSAVGLSSARTIELTVGAVLSREYTSPSV